jgi:cyanophycin synthetase
MSPQDDIKLLRINYLRGPNIWTYRPVIEAWVDIGELEEFPSNKIPGLYERLTAWLPTLVEHRCGVGERGGFWSGCARAPGRRTSWSMWCSNCRAWPACRPASARPASTSESGVYKVAFRTRQEEGRTRRAGSRARPADGRHRRPSL